MATRWGTFAPSRLPQSINFNLNMPTQQQNTHSLNSPASSSLIRPVHRRSAFNSTQKFIHIRGKFASFYYNLIFHGALPSGILYLCVTCMPIEMQISGGKSHLVYSAKLFFLLVAIPLAIWHPLNKRHMILESIFWGVGRDGQWSHFWATNAVAATTNLIIYWP